MLRLIEKRLFVLLLILVNIMQHATLLHCYIQLNGHCMSHLKYGIWRIRRKALLWMPCRWHKHPYKLVEYQAGYFPVPIHYWRSPTGTVLFHWFSQHGWTRWSPRLPQLIEINVCWYACADDRDVCVRVCVCMVAGGLSLFALVRSVVLICLNIGSLGTSFGSLRMLRGISGACQS